MNESRPMMETLKNFSKMTNRKLKSSFRRAKVFGDIFPWKRIQSKKNDWLGTENRKR